MSKIRAFKLEVRRKITLSKRSKRATRGEGACSVHKFRHHVRMLFWPTGGVTMRWWWIEWSACWLIGPRTGQRPISILIWTDTLLIGQKEKKEVRQAHGNLFLEGTKDVTIRSGQIRDFVFATERVICFSRMFGWLEMFRIYLEQFRPKNNGVQNAKTRLDISLYFFMTPSPILSTYF